MSEIKTISGAGLEERLRAGGAFEFWNVLTDEYFHGEMLPGSRRVPLDTVGREVREKNLPRDTEIVVYCAGPKCPQSRMAGEKLEALGYTKVRAYEGGIEEWKELGHTVETVTDPVAA
jgi:rhodanese-related sulfurtransferase